MKKTIIAILCLCLLPLLGCGASEPLDPKNPVTLTMWHNFGGGMQQTMDILIDEFNATVGKERGVIVSVEAISASANLQEALAMILNGDPGAPSMPDIVTAYPKTAIQFKAKELITNLDEYFSEEELSAYIPAFVDEGRFGDGGLYVFPFAKSTELLFLNQTLFDRFSAATGVTTDCFGSFEGIADAAARYYEWTDGQTPDVHGDGKQFYTADSWVNLAQAGMLQQGAQLFNGESLDLYNPAYKHIWQTCYTPSVAGGFAIYDGYSSDLSKTGDIICSSGSSAGVLFYGDTVTYPDNITTEKVEYSILPYPVFEGGKPVAIQRGNGFMVAKSSLKREYAAAEFLKWFSAPKQNIRFVAETGYMPVTNTAFDAMIPQLMETAPNPLIRKMLEAVMKMYANYEFFTAPVFESYDAIAKDYELNYKTLLKESQKARVSGQDIDMEDSLAAFTALWMK